MLGLATRSATVIVRALAALTRPHIPASEAAASEAGTRGLSDAAKALAMTVVDLVANPEIVDKV